MAYLHSVKILFRRLRRWVAPEHVWEELVVLVALFVQDARVEVSKDGEVVLVYATAWEGERQSYGEIENVPVIHVMREISNDRAYLAR